jgi:hypothetical protein
VLKRGWSKLKRNKLKKLLKPKYIQRDCRESENVGLRGVVFKPDYRQAEAVTRFRPDIIVFEHPNNNKTPEITGRLVYAPNPELLRVHPWAAADQKLYKNIDDLQRSGHEIKLY